MDSKVLDTSEFEIVEDPYFASILNNYGEVQIGSDIFKITRNYAYRVSVTDAELLKSVSLRQPDHSALLEFQVGSFETNKIERSIQTFGTSKNNETMVSSRCSHDFVRNRRFSGESWVTDYWVYASAGAKSISKRKAGIRGWVNNAITHISLETTYNVTDSDDTNTYGTETKVVQNGYTAKNIIAQDWGWKATMKGRVSSYHEGTRSSVTRSCSTSVQRGG